MTELTLRWAGGELDLMGWNDSTHGSFLIETLADGTEWGNPQTVRRALRRFMLDGSASVKEYDDNRTIPLKLRVKAADGNSLAGAEAALVQTDSRRCELVWQGSDYFSAPAVFVAVSTDLTHTMDDLADLRSERFYTLTLDCQPHVLSNEWVEVPAVAQGTSTPTLVDACASTTGWTASGATLAVAGSTITVTVDPPALGGGDWGVTSFTVTRTGAVDLTTEKYLSTLVLLRSGASLTSVEVQASSGAWETVPASGADAGARIHDAGAVTDPTVTAIRWTFTKPPGDGLPFLGGGTSGIWATFDTVSKQSTPRSTASKQATRTLTVPGSRRTPTSLHAESPTTDLGTVLLYTGPAYDPSLSRGGVSARTTTAGNVSGSRNVFVTGNTEQFRILASEFTEGFHALWVRISPNDATTTGVLTTTVHLLDAANNVLKTGVSFTNDLAWGSTAYVVSLLGGLDLPAWQLPEGSGAKIQITLQWDVTVGLPVADRAINLDELWAFNLAEGALTIAEVGARRDLWLDPATLAVDHPVTYAGTGDRSDAIPLSLATELPSWPGTHVIEPPTTYLFGASTGAADMEISGYLRPAHHTHPTS